MLVDSDEKSLALPALTDRNEVNVKRRVITSIVITI